MKFRLSVFWCAFLILAFFSHAMKTFLILFAMLLIHEAAHVMTAMKLHYQVDEMMMTPFGFHARIRSLDHGRTIEKLLILCAGLAMHLIFPFIFNIGYHLHLISWSYMEYLLQLNRAILLFNLLPIYPLDGGRILLALMQLIFSYGTAKKIMYGISLALLLFLFSAGPLNMKIMLIFLFLLLVREMKDSYIDLTQYHYYRKVHSQE